MKSHGDFNSSYGMYQYNFFSQSSTFPYVIAGVRSDLNHTIYYYSWPYLNPVRSVHIPDAPQGKAIGAKEVHICDKISTTYAMVKYKFSGDGTKLVVVTLDSYI